MIHTNPTPDDRRGSKQTESQILRNSNDKQPESAELGQPSLPRSPITGSQIDAAKSLLMTERFGISYAAALSSLIKEKSWVMSEVPHKDSLEITRKLVRLHPELAKEYQALVSSEGFLAVVFAAIPFIGRPRPSTQFLEANKEINRIFGDLEQAQLLRVNHMVESISAGGGRMGLGGVSSYSLWIVSPTDFGKLALQMHLEAQ